MNDGVLVLVSVMATVAAIGVLVLVSLRAIGQSLSVVLGFLV